MTKSNRIILNTLASYGRSVYAMVLGLCSARWVLEALGASDFGLYGVVGSLIVFIGFLNNVSNASVARFYAYSVGRGQTRSQSEAVSDLRAWFNTAFSVHFVVPVILVVIGWPLGEWAVMRFLVIPTDRVMSCVWVFRFSLIAMFVSMVTLPYIAMYMAHQYIANLSIFGIISSTLVFVGSFLLRYAHGDRLLLFALMMLFIHSVIPILQSAFAYRLFPACRVRFSEMFNSNRLKQMFGFAGWQLFGGIGGVLRGQGSAILVNLYFGSRVNAAFTIANQVCSQTTTLSTALLGALSPAVTNAEGAGNREEARSLSFRACKFGVLLVLLFAIPLMTEIDYVLRLWLKEPPAYTSLLCIGMILVLLIDKLTFGHMVAITATGKVAAYQATLGTLMFLTPFIGWVLIKCGISVWAVPASFILTVSLCSFCRLLFCRKLVGMSIRYWACSVFVPLLPLGVGVTAMGLFVRSLTGPSFARLCLVTGVDVVTLLFGSWLFVMTESERVFLVSKIRRVLGR